MAKSGEIQARRQLIADLFREERDSVHTVDSVLDVLRTHTEMREFWNAFEARQKKSRQKPKRTTSQGAAGKRKEKKPIVKSGLDVTSAVRLVQRDLDILEAQGLVEAVVIKEGRKIAVTSDDRRARVSGAAVGGSAQPLLWRAGRNLADDFEVEGVAAAVALKAICGKMAWLVPVDLMTELLEARDRAILRMAKMRSSSPQRRWLAALELETQSPAFERPMFDDDVRQAIEQAILRRKQLRLNFDDKTIVCSVSRFIVKLPDRPVIELWDHAEGELWPGGPKGPWCNWVRLETIKKAELLETDAFWPVLLGEEAAASKRPHRSMVYELRASPKQMSKWAGTWLLDQMELIGVDSTGWHVCRFVDTGEPSGFRRYLGTLGAAVEVLKPLNFRTALAQHFAAAAAMYGNVQDVRIEVEQARPDEETLAAWCGVPRLVSPNLVMFTQDDHERLQCSPAWRAEPSVIEGLCRLFCAVDPAGLYSPSNPHAATEYLSEAENLFGRLPRIQSQRELADEIRAIIHQAFASDDPADDIVDFADWDGLAGIAWLELTGFRVQLRATPEA